jgi:hypothetical protein
MATHHVSVTNGTLTLSLSIFLWLHVHTCLYRILSSGSASQLLLQVTRQSQRKKIILLIVSLWSANKHRWLQVSRFCLFCVWNRIITTTSAWTSLLTLNSLWVWLYISQCINVWHNEVSLLNSDKIRLKHRLSLFAIITPGNYLTFLKLYKKWIINFMSHGYNRIKWVKIQKDISTVPSIW